MSPVASWEHNGKSFPREAKRLPMVCGCSRASAWRTAEIACRRSSLGLRRSSPMKPSPPGAEPLAATGSRKGSRKAISRRRVTPSSGRVQGGFWLDATGTGLRPSSDRGGLQKSRRHRFASAVVSLPITPMTELEVYCNEDLCLMVRADCRAFTIFRARPEYCAAIITSNTTSYEFSTIPLTSW